MLLYNMKGECCGNFEDGQAAPSGYWLRPNDSKDTMTPLEFLDKIGLTRFSGIWTAALQNPTLAFSMMRGFAAQNIDILESFPTLLYLESIGLLPAGTAIEIWS